MSARRELTVHGLKILQFYISKLCFRRVILQYIELLRSQHAKDLTIRCLTLFWHAGPRNISPVGARLGVRKTIVVRQHFTFLLTHFPRFKRLFIGSSYKKRKMEKKCFISLDIIVIIVLAQILHKIH